MSIKKLFTLGIITALLAVAPAANSVVPSAQDEISSSSGMANLQSCMQQPDAALNIVYLMDISRSMDESDPNSLRAPMMVATLDLFKDLAESTDKPVNYNFITFGKKDAKNENSFSGWKELNAESFEDARKEVGDGSKKQDGNGTDWLGGLKNVRAQLENDAPGGEKACNLVLWMTDGEINPLPDKDDSLKVGPSDQSEYAVTPQDIKDIKDLCSTTADWFRDKDNNTLLLGALLNANTNVDTIKEKSIGLFQAVVEGKTSTGLDQEVISAFKIQDIADVATGEVTCGKQGGRYANIGKVVEGKNSADLSWQFVDLVASARNLVKADLDSGSSFPVGTAVGHVEVYTMGSTEPVLKDSLGQIVEAESELISAAGSGENIYSIKYDLPAEAPSGDWTVEGDGDTKVFLGVAGANRSLSLVLKNPEESKFENEQIQGEKLKVEFAVESNTTPLNVQDFESIEICIGQSIDNSKNDAACADAKDSNGRSGRELVFSSPGVEQRIEASAKLVLAGTSEEIRVVAKRIELKVGAGDDFAQVSCLKKKTIEGVEHCDLGTIPNSVKSLTAALAVSAAKSGKPSTITILPDQFESNDDDLERKKKYFIKLKNSVTVSGDKSNAVIEFELSNSKNKTAKEVTGRIYYSVTRENGEPSENSIAVVWAIDNKASLLKIILVFLALLLFAVLPPYLWLLTSTRKNARFFDDMVYIASIPARLTDEGKLVSLTDRVVSEDGQGSAETSPGAELLPPDWKKIQGPIHVDAKQKEFGLGECTVKIQPVGFNALRPIQVRAEAIGSLLISNMGRDSLNLKVDSTTAGQSLAGLAVFVAGANRILDPRDTKTFVAATEREDSFDVQEASFGYSNELRANAEPIDGRLYFVISGTSDPKQSLDRISSSLGSANLESVVKEITALRDERLHAALAEVSVVAKSAPEAILETKLSTKPSDPFDDFSDTNTQSTTYPTENRSQSTEDFDI